MKKLGSSLPRWGRGRVFSFPYLVSPGCRRAGEGLLLFWRAGFADLT